ncbi:uncharacterized protein CcaverHIS019_0311950 [Cutaneotrichosporon cavernicola]|uniref:Uncharacterized protein n=1 Tax=Cutaneotrichosporon cavernicola TaxID=279322 RepID=A0AA48QV87_9TREE|nr:uncharacterized protein CcaverHIS019_0311950 [Cutaneotrichosporon cavernicola]BEI91125.1 hypothetical protein CcaverHIS019_0311950 [Cutaneotrichosporon cavernicola]
MAAASGSNAPIINDALVAWPPPPSRSRFASSASPPQTARNSRFSLASPPTNSFPIFSSIPLPGYEEEEDPKGKGRALSIDVELDYDRQPQTFDYGASRRPLTPAQLGRIAQSFGIIAPNSLSAADVAPSRTARSRSPNPGPSLLSVPTQNLVVVMPPPSLLPPDDSLSPVEQRERQRRFQRGRLLPLQPTLGAMLAAIAREFGLPSTLGVYVYLGPNCGRGRERLLGSRSSETSDDEDSGPLVTTATWPRLFAHASRPPSPGTTHSATPRKLKRSFGMSTPTPMTASPLTAVGGSIARGPSPSSETRQGTIVDEPSPFRSSQGSSSASSFSPRTPGSTLSTVSAMPVFGTIEFDIDPNEARWLGAWLKAGGPIRRRAASDTVADHPTIERRLSSTASQSSSHGPGSSLRIRNLQLVERLKDERPKFLRDMEERERALERAREAEREAKELAMLAARRASEMEALRRQAEEARAAEEARLRAEMEAEGEAEEERRRAEMEAQAAAEEERRRAEAEAQAAAEEERQRLVEEEVQRRLAQELAVEAERRRAVEEKAAEEERERRAADLAAEEERRRLAVEHAVEVERKRAAEEATTAAAAAAAAAALAAAAVAAEQRRREQAEAAAAGAEEQRRRAEADAATALAEEQRRRAEAEAAAAAAEEQRRREEAKAAAAAEEERLRKLEEEHVREEEEQRQRAEEERLRKLEEARLREEEEARLREEEEARLREEEEARLREEEEARLREEEEARLREEEEARLREEEEARLREEEEARLREEEEARLREEEEARLREEEEARLREQKEERPRELEHSTPSASPEPMYAQLDDDDDESHYSHSTSQNHANVISPLTAMRSLPTDDPMDDLAALHADRAPREGPLTELDIGTARALNGPLPLDKLPESSSEDSLREVAALLNVVDANPEVLSDPTLASPKPPATEILASPEQSTSSLPPTKSLLASPFVEDKESRLASPVNFPARGSSRALADFPVSPVDSSMGVSPSPSTPVINSPALVHLRGAATNIDQRGSGQVMEDQLNNLERMMRDLSPRDIQYNQQWPSPPTTSPPPAVPPKSPPTWVNDLPPRGSSRLPYLQEDGSNAGPSSRSVSEPTKSPPPIPNREPPARPGHAQRPSAALSAGGSPVVIATTLDPLSRFPGGGLPEAPSIPSSSAAAPPRPARPPTPDLTGIDIGPHHLPQSMTIRVEKGSSPREAPSRPQRPSSISLRGIKRQVSKSVLRPQKTGSGTHDPVGLFPRQAGDHPPPSSFASMRNDGFHGREASSASTDSEEGSLRSRLFSFAGRRKRESAEERTISHISGPISASHKHITPAELIAQAPPSVLTAAMPTLAATPSATSLNERPDSLNSPSSPHHVRRKPVPSIEGKESRNSAHGSDLEQVPSLPSLPATHTTLS